MVETGKTEQDRATRHEDALMDLIQCDHRVIEANTAAMSLLMGTLDSMQETLRLLVGQVTTSISQRNEGVPIKVFMVVVLVMAAIVAVTIGVDISALRDVAP